MLVPVPVAGPQPEPGTYAHSYIVITAAELHIRADLGVIDAAEKTLTADPATGQSAPGMAPPQSAAG